MQMRVYKQFYMIFVLMRACLWDVSSSFAGNGKADASADYISKDEDINGDILSITDRRVLYTTDNNAAEQQDFLRTQTSHVNALPVFHRDKIHDRKSMNGERARFLRLLLFPNHSFG